MAVARTRRLLVLRALGLGDLLTAVPALRGLAGAFPDHHRALAAPRALAPLVELVRSHDGTPVVHEVADACPLAPLDPRLRAPDVAVNLHGRGPQSHRVLRALQPRRLVAFAQRATGGPGWRAGEHEVARWCRMLEESGIPCDAGALQIDAPARRVPAVVRGATLLHPGAASAARRWPPARWAAVARAEHAAGRRVVLTGGPDEVGLARSIANDAGLPSEAVLAGHTPLDALAAVVAAAGRVVCGDTGISHLATALGTPSVVLFGPTSPREWGPPPGHGPHRILWAGSTGDPHAARPDPGLLRIEVGDVLAALRTVRGRASSPSRPRAGPAGRAGGRGSGGTPRRPRSRRTSAR